MKNFNDKLSVSAAAALAFAVFCVLKAKGKPKFPFVNLSNFMLVLQKKLVEEVIFDGSHILFRCVN